MAVPFIDLRRFEPGFLDRWLAKCREISEATRFVGGSDVVALEANLVEHCEVAGAVACANGTDALQLCLRAAGVGEGDRVLIPDATFWATFEAVVNCGARPVTVDIDREDLQMDFELFQQAVEEYQPKAVILVHLYGWGSARLSEFRNFCRQRNLPLIEDGAQGFGVRWGEESLFHGAYLSTLSFYPAKVLGACGDAGAVLCSSVELEERVRQLGNHGRTGHYDHGLVGWNSRMGGFDGAFLNLSLDYFEVRMASRQRIAKLYRQRLPELGFKVCEAPEGYEENGYLNVTLVPPEERPRIQEALSGQGISFGTVYPGSMSTQSAARGLLAGRVGGEEAERLSQSVVNLPLFAYLRPQEVEEVLAAMEASAGV